VYIVESNKVGRVRHRQSEGLVRVSDRDDHMLREGVLRNQADDSGVEVDVLGQADEFDTDLLVSFFESFCEDPCQSQGKCRVLRQKIPEVSAG
jgi:hypothetical protein